MTQAIHNLLRHRAEQTPEAMAFRFHHQGDAETIDWTCAKTFACANAIAAELAQRVKPGDRVVLALDPGLHFIASLFAIFQVGATAVPSFPPQGSRAMARFASIYRSCSPTLIIAEPVVQSLVPRLDEAAGKTASPAQWLFIDSKDHSRFDGVGSESIVSVNGSADVPALLQYTSGSTGEPKGVILTHPNLISNSRTLEHVMAGARPHLGFSWLPPYHDMGLMGALLLSVYSGFTLHTMSPGHFLQRPLRWLQAISEFGVTTTVGPNFALEHCVNGISDEEVAQLDLSRLKLFFCGAEPVRSATIDRFVEKFGPVGFDRRAFLPCYGMAEATLFVSGRTNLAVPAAELSCDAAALSSGRLMPPREGEAPSVRVVSCGEPALDHEVVIADPETCEQRPDGEVGEIWVAGPSVALGYFENPEVTQRVFAGQLAGSGESGRKYLRTGDLGVLSGGELFITGRIKEVINFNGRNLYPQDIETSVLGLHPSFRANGVAAFSVEEGGAERLVIVAELSRASRLNRAALAQLQRAIVEAVTAGHGVAPHAVLLVMPATIPLTTSGKIQRTLCRDHYAQQEFHKRLMAPKDEGVEQQAATV